MLFMRLPAYRHKIKKWIILPILGCFGKPQFGPATVFTKEAPKSKTGGVGVVVGGQSSVVRGVKEGKEGKVGREFSFLTA